GVDLEVRNSRHPTPLLLAVRHGRVSIICTLLEHGVSARVGDTWLWTALDIAITKPRDETFENMIRLLSFKPMDMSQRNSAGRTPLCAAAAGGNVHAVRLLLEHEGREVNWRDCMGFTPLYYATVRGYAGIVKMLEGGGRRGFRR
ncbi:ankyrin, partial [Choiromyces venosus 120613-1]